MSYIPAGKREYISVFYGPNDRPLQQRQGELFHKLFVEAGNTAKIDDLWSNQAEQAKFSAFIHNLKEYHRRLNTNAYPREIEHLKKNRYRYPSFINANGTVDTGKYENFLTNNVDTHDTKSNGSTGDWGGNPAKITVAGIFANSGENRPNAIYSANTTAYHDGDNFKEFNYNLSKMAHKAIFKNVGIYKDTTLDDIAKAEISDNPYDQPGYNFGDAYGATGGLWTKQKGKYGYYFTNASGNEEFNEVNYKDIDDARSPVNDNDCLGSGLGANAGSCDKIIEDCLTSGDVTKCVDTLNNIGNVTVTNTITNLHPAVALKFLKLFGFRQGVDKDGKNKIINVTTWLNTFAKNKLSVAQIDQLKQSNILEFLKLLVAYINYHNGVLGEGTSTKTSTEKGVLSGKIGSELKMYKAPDRSNNPTFVAGLLRTNIRNQHPGNFFGSYGVLGGLGGMYGGSQEQENGFRNGSIMPFVNGSIGSISQEGGNRFIIRAPYQGVNKCGAKLVRKIIDGQITSLRAKGKTLDSQSNNKIKTWLDKLEEAENTYLKYLQILQKANQIYSNSRDNKQEEMSIDRLENFVEKHKHIQQKHRNIYQILTDIYSQLANLEGDKQEEYVDDRFRPINI